MCKGSQITINIDEKLCLGEIMFLGEGWRNGVLRICHFCGLYESSVLVNAVGSVSRRLKISISKNKFESVSTAA